MTFRDETAATVSTAAGKRCRVRLAVLGGAVAALPVVGLVAANGASAASVSTWNAVAQCESTGNWSIENGNGFSGGLQFTPSTWAAYGGTQYASTAAQASQAQQIAVAEKVLADQGPGAWPVCSAKAGLTAGGPAAQSQPSKPQAQAQPEALTQAPQAPQAPKQAPQPKQTPGSTAKPTAPAQPQRAATGGSYTVKSGDTLSAIAAAHGTSVAALHAANAQTIGGNPDLIMPGQQLAL
ncbi:LysM peptidoglycan-binding domain-containing protein [Kitasatospora sp. LaBMicrA B282]|uniref:LysM peptidoglycan-binding domain-containing protein n=1 Tax=Kitasatospora sp. LaBMicrA B282 TaxID=3420949 RepID=UPI003D0D3F07